MHEYMVVDAFARQPLDGIPVAVFFDSGDLDPGRMQRILTELKGKASWFLPFDQGYQDGAGNPPNPQGLKTDYLWKRILTPCAFQIMPGGEFNIT